MSGLIGDCQSGDLSDIAKRYLEAGWPPFPLPFHAKTPPPEGRTGYKGVDMTLAEIEAEQWGGNIGVRMPVDVLGLDVDVYHGGDKTLKQLVSDLGPLPNTWISHSGRNDNSGIRFFRVPIGSWVFNLPGIEIIQFVHRFAAVWPSIHPEDRPYGWWDQNEGGPSEEIPLVEDLPELPWAWVEYLSRDTPDGVHSKAVDQTGMSEFISTHEQADQASYITVIVTEFDSKTSAGHSRHDTMQHCLIWAMENARAEVVSAKTAIEVLAERWVEAVQPDRRRMELWSDRRVTEFDAMVRHAVGKAEAKTQDEIYKIHDENAGITMNPPPVGDGADAATTPSRDWRSLIVDGRSWLRSGSATVETVWGDKVDSLIPKLQPTLIVGETGAGKTTLVHLVILGSIGVPGHADLLGWPVLELADGERVLYLASDRPDQARIAMLRYFAGQSEAVWKLAEDRLRVWRGPPPDSLAHRPGLLLEMAEEAGAGLVITDSTKDMAVKLSDDGVGAAVNQAHQLVVASGRDMIALHHPRKRGREFASERPTLDDVFGSAWLTYGAGSVLFLIEEPHGTEVLQLKTPNGRESNFRFRIDPATGLLAASTDVVLDAVIAAGPPGISTKRVAEWVSGVPDPTEAQIARIRRRLQVLELAGAIITTGGGNAKRWMVP